MMKFHNMLPFRRNAWTNLALLSLVLEANAVEQLCSKQNTGSSFPVVDDIYQSNGACTQTCSGNYAFAIVQYQSCWCSDYAPAQTVDVDTYCNVGCPGFPDDKCGDKDAGYYGYIALGVAPSGTVGAAGASSSSQPSSTSQSSTEDPETSITPSPSSTPVTTSSLSTSTQTSPTLEVVATPSVMTTVISGAVVTQTVTSTPIVAPGSKPDNVQLQRKSGLGAGAVAGIVIGVIAGLAVIALGAFLLWRRRRNAGDGEKQGSVVGSKKDMQRNVSVLSKSGLLGGRARPSTAERDWDEPYGMTGNNSNRHSMLFSGADGISPVSPLDSSHSGSSRRPSKPMVYDQRLNPSALFANAEANGSRISMQDTQDYSRPLGVTNPDPRASFESRLSHQ